MLHRLRARAVDPDLSDHVEDQILGLDPLLEAVVINELQRLGHPEPQLAQRERAREIGGSDAGREIVERAVGAAVRVGADHQLARQHQAVLRQHGVADAPLPHLEVPLDSHVARELPREAAEGRARGVLGGLEVVLCDGDALRVPDLLSAHLLAHDLSGRRNREVVAHREVDLREHQVAGHDALPSRAAGQDLLRHGHAHLANPSAS